MPKPEHTPSFEEYPVTIAGDETILLGFGVDPGDGDDIMVFVDGTPIDDARRTALVGTIGRALKGFDPMRNLLLHILQEVASPRFTDRHNLAGDIRDVLATVRGGGS